MEINTEYLYLTQVCTKNCVGQKKKSIKYVIYFIHRSHGLKQLLDFLLGALDTYMKCICCGPTVKSGSTKIPKPTFQIRSLVHVRLGLNKPKSKTKHQFNLKWNSLTILFTIISLDFLSKSLTLQSPQKFDMSLGALFMYILLP